MMKKLRKGYYYCMCYFFLLSPVLVGCLPEYIDTLHTVEAVDLGLSVKWASCNVGAISPEYYGGYYGWGDAKIKIAYNWGDSWRMPTMEEIEELSIRCTWEWIKINDVYGQKVTGPNGNSIFLPAADDASYYSYEEYSPPSGGSGGYYWINLTGTNIKNGTSGCYFGFDKGGYDGVSVGYGGLRTVRPVLGQ